MYARKYRLFHADVELNAPKDRTLFNYNIKDGWPTLCKFLGKDFNQKHKNLPQESKRDT